MALYCLLITLVAVILLIVLSLLLADIRSISKQMQYKNETDSSFSISISSSLKSLRTLQKALNTLYAKKERCEEQADQKERAMRTLMSGISHDIRTPLTSIKGYLHLLWQTDDPSLRTKYLHILNHRLDTLSDLLEDLFIHSRIQDQTYAPPKEKLHLYPLVCQVLASYYMEFESRGIEPEIHFADERLEVWANREMLVRMVQNLINNALKYGSGPFTIAQREDGLIFSNAMSHPEKLDLERLFERFYTADDARHDHSSGLGLAIVKEIVERHGWSIYACRKQNILSIHIHLNLQKKTGL